MTRKFWMAAGLAAALVALCGCAEKKPVLHIYTWSDYIKPELVQQFEQENHCQVVIDTYDSNESMYAKLKAGATGYDLLFPSSYMVKIMADQGMLQKLNLDLIPNRTNIDPAYMKLAIDKEMVHSVPYTVTITCLGYLGSKVKDFQPTWSMLDREDLKGRMTMLNDHREVIGSALKYLGYSLNTLDDQQLAQAKEVVLRWKKNLAKFENEQYKNGLASGEFLLTHGYSGDLLLVQSENPDIQIAVPREGSQINFDDMVIPVGAPQPELAHKMINFILEPQSAAELTDYIKFLCPNLPSYDLLAPEIRANPILFPPAEVVAKLETLSDLGENNVKYTKIWDEIKGGE
jgi:spermidine/putrescine transport system substrate-binding protein